MTHLTTYYLEGGMTVGLYDHGWQAIVGTDDRRESACGYTPRGAVRRARWAWRLRGLQMRLDARQLRRIHVAGEVRHR